MDNEFRRSMARGLAIEDLIDKYPQNRRQILEFLINSRYPQNSEEEEREYLSSLREFLHYMNR